MKKSNILYTVPTIAANLPKISHECPADSNNNLIIHEDDWAQIEFLPLKHLRDVAGVLQSVKEHSERNKAGEGWMDVYVRPAISDTIAFYEEEFVDRVAIDLAGVRGPAPTISSGGRVMGIVSGGFTVTLPGGLILYGVTSAGKISVLSAHVPNDQANVPLAEAFAKLNTSLGLLLVDWRSQFVLMSLADDGGINIWRPN